MIWLSMGTPAAVIKEDGILTQTFDEVSVVEGVFQTMRRKRGEIRVCQQFLRECMFILSVTVGLNLIWVGWVCSAVRLLSHRHTLRSPCEVPEADRLAVTSAPYLEISQTNSILHTLATLSGYYSVTKLPSSVKTQQSSIILLPDCPWHI